MENLRSAIDEGFLPKECAVAMDEIKALIDAGKFDEANARIAFYQQRAAAHAARTPKEIQAIKDAWAQKLKRDETTRLIADNVLKVARDYAEVDYSTLQKLIADNNLTKMREEARNVAQAVKAMRDEEKALSDLIPNAHEWHKSFTIAELKEAHAKIQATLDYWKAKGYDLATDSNLSILKTELEQKIQFVETPGAFKAGLKAHKTWQVQQDSYIKLLDKVENRIEIIKLDADYNTLLGFKTTSKDFKDYMAKAKAALDAGDPATAKHFIYSAESKKKMLEGKRKRKISVTGQQKVTASFADTCFTAARKKNALNAANEWDANKELLPDAVRAYAQATREMKEAAESYTHASGSITKMLRGLDGFYELDLSYAVKSAKEIDNLTELIGFNLLKRDMWLYRDERAAFFALKTGGIDVNKVDKYAAALKDRLTSKYGVTHLTGTALQEYKGKKERYIKLMEKLLVGRTGEDPSFLSCGSHFNHYFCGTGGDNMYGIPKVRLEIYCPKGTQGLYAAPFNHYNSKNTGSDGFWNGKDAPNLIREAEVFLQRGTKYRVVEAKYNDLDDRWLVKVEVIGQEVREIDGYEYIIGKKGSGYKAKFK